MLSKAQLTKICMLNQGAYQCRYLDEGDYCCLKLSSNKKIIDEQVAEHLKDAAKKGIDPKASGDPLGTGHGCHGYPLLKHKLQGFDQ